MEQKRKVPALALLFAAAFAIAGVLASAAVAETPEPRVLSLPDRTEATLPGAFDGESHGILVRRGSGFPEPVVVEAPNTEDTVEAPAPTRRVIIRRSRYGY
ncbi:MAG: hypothetical protein AAF222_11755 [Pseudomonadota bacterium]